MAVEELLVMRACIAVPTCGSLFATIAKLRQPWVRWRPGRIGSATWMPAALGNDVGETGIDRGWPVASFNSSGVVHVDLDMRTVFDEHPLFEATVVPELSDQGLV
eukprot:CAMPEP_0180554996 /NCGR_PEP_ID=MMETSP1036_2-20121128/75198_1 /TAXON_ID=632150 /ORGANISM="Azadinium spinosum, Strain 3D9" /LENGTH=104 /DNA_ID=CAMNT_0022570797 /DNA_START=275 /DNA_END=587 /DNA_ORIENTATION=+